LDRINASRLMMREEAREQRFSRVWSEELNDVFADVAPYYDRANNIASLGMWEFFLQSFMLSIDVWPGQRVLDVCAGTNAIGIALLDREPELEVYAFDRSAAMQEVGQQRAKAKGFVINSVIGDAHELPFPDNHFDVVTLQFATRHLKVKRAFEEIRRVLKPGGHFYHSDMLRPANPIVEKLYYRYLRTCLSFTGFLFGSGEPALNCKNYFINALEMFYSAEELSAVLREVGFGNVAARTLLGGMLGFHRAAKPLPR
jgi:demethylmenaquinone methyltransferase/2-methoxy-6-polyprenyl-1,4-benzoquinol methylase